MNRRRTVPLVLLAALGFGAWSLLFDPAPRPPAKKVVPAASPAPPQPAPRKAESADDDLVAAVQASPPAARQG